MPFICERCLGRASWITSELEAAVARPRRREVLVRFVKRGQDARRRHERRRSRDRRESRSGPTAALSRSSGRLSDLVPDLGELAAAFRELDNARCVVWRVTHHDIRIAEEAIKGATPRRGPNGSPAELGALLIDNEVPPQAMLVV
jgi:hypothetical protein